MEEKPRKHRKPSLKQIALVQVGIILLLISGLTYVFSQSSGIFTITEGIYPGAPTFTIWREVNSYRAKDSFGIIQTSGNASSLIASCILANSRILLKAGTYVITAKIIKAVDNVIIEGEGDATILQTASATAINIFELNGRSGWVIRNLAIDGNKATQSNAGDFQRQNGIWAWNGAHDLTFTGLKIYNTYRAGIFIRNWTTTDVMITQNRISSTGTSGIYVTYGNRITITNNHIVNCGGTLVTDYGALYCYAHGATISGNNIYGGDCDGIEVYPCQNTTVVGNMISHVGRMGIYLQESTLLPGYGQTGVVSGNFIDHTGLNPDCANPWKDGIKIHCPYLTVSGNFIKDAGECGIYLTEKGFNSTIIGNEIVGCYDGIYLDEVWNNVISGNTIIDSTNFGLVLYDADSCVVSSNMIRNYDASAVGLVISAGSSYNVFDAHVIKGGSVGIYEADPSAYNIISSCVTLAMSGVGIKMTTSEVASTTRVVNCWNKTAWVASWGSG